MTSAAQTPAGRTSCTAQTRAGRTSSAARIPAGKTVLLNYLAGRAARPLGRARTVVLGDGPERQG